jgi:hypothetical protein
MFCAGMLGGALVVSGGDVTSGAGLGGGGLVSAVVVSVGATVPDASPSIPSSALHAASSTAIAAAVNQLGRASGGRPSRRRCR